MHTLRDAQERLWRLCAMLCAMLWRGSGDALEALRDALRDALESIRRLCAMFCAMYCLGAFFSAALRRSAGVWGSCQS